MVAFAPMATIQDLTDAITEYTTATASVAAAQTDLDGVQALIDADCATEIAARNAARATWEAANAAAQTNRGWDDAFASYSDAVAVEQGKRAQLTTVMSEWLGIA